MRRIIAFISDEHIFARYGLNLPEYVTCEKVKIVSGDGQNKIFESWSNFCEICDRLEVDTVINDGDLVHGQNFIERGTLLYSPNMDEQIDAATKIMDMIVSKPCKFGPTRKFHVFSGSGYHNSAKGMHVEKSVADRLGGIFHGPIRNMIFPPSTKVFNIAHGESAAYIYREMLLGRAGLNIREAQAINKIPKIDVFVRGHWHQYIHIEEKKIHMVQLPSWIAFEPSKPYLKDYGKMQPDIGGCIVMLDDEDRFKIWHFLYDVPHIVDEIIEG